MRSTLALLAAAPIALHAQQPARIAAGPMVGHSEMRAVALWVQTTAAARVQIAYWDTTDPGTRRLTAPVTTEARTAFTARLLAEPLEPGRGYAYEVLIGGRPQRLSWPLRFQSQALWQWRTDPPVFRFAVGSCFYVNETIYDRPGTPYGSEYQILGAIHQARPDFMIWTGDNTYLREADWFTRTGILHRYAHTRALPELQPLLGSTHHYATWDDHDYGPNDADRSYRDKAWTREAFDLFWANPQPAFPGEGIATRFQWGDVEFFLVDNRWWRTPNNRRAGERTQLGAAQREWLIDALASSEAPFRFVVMGGVFLNDVARFEHYATYPEERQWLIDRITENRIPGVIFLTGDKHFTEMSRLERPGTYPLYDLTVSALTAGINNRGLQDRNTLRVDGTHVAEHNFGLLEVRGPRTARELVITIHGVDGRPRWTRTIAAAELR